MQQAFRFVRCVRHHKPGQLVRRAHKLARRAWIEKFGGPNLFGARSERAAPPRSATPPIPVFRSRMHLAAAHDDHATLELIGTSVPLVSPFDWKLAHIERAPLLLTFHLHAMEWLEALDDVAFEAVTSDWIARIDRESYGRDAWHPFVISLRAVVWMQQSARRAQRLASEFRDALDRSIAAQIRTLAADLERDLGGNHILKNAKALVWAGAYFTGFEAQRWSRLGASILSREVTDQMLADGMHFERSPAYHAQVIADLIECRAVLAPGLLRDQLDAAIVRGAVVVADLAHPDGAPSLFNDGGMHMAYAPSEIQGVVARTLRFSPIPRPIFALDSAGYYGARKGKSYVVADCGAIGPDHLPAHGHADAFSFEWTVAGERLVVDAGVFEYQPGALRDASRSTKSHNTLTLDDRDACEFWSSFRVGRRCRVRKVRWQELNEGFALEGTHDGYAHLAGEPIHRRFFRATPDEIVIEDRVEGGAGQIARARLLLHPDCRVTTDPDGVVTIRRGRAAARIVAETPIEIVDAEWFPDFGVRMPTKQLVVTYGTAPCVGGMRLRAIAP